MPQQFGEKLRRLRRQNRMTQAELAEQLALASHAHIANLEAGRDVPSLALVIRIARRLGVTTDYLLRDTIEVEGSVASTVAPLREAESPPFGAKLRALRRRRDLSQKELVGRLGLISRAYISDLEAGRKAPSLDLVVQIADLFEVTTDYLLRESLPVGEIESGAEG